MSKTIELKNLKKEINQTMDIPESEDRIPENEAEKPAIEVKKTVIEKFCDKRYEKRVERAEKKAAKAEEPKPEKDHKKKLVKIGGGILAGAGVLLGAAAAIAGSRTNGGSFADADGSCEGSDPDQGCVESDSSDSESSEA